MAPKKKVLYKIPKEDEIEKKTTEAKTTEAVSADLPVVEPKPVATEASKSKPTPPAPKAPVEKKVEPEPPKEKKTIFARPAEATIAGPGPRPKGPAVTVLTAPEMKELSWAEKRQHRAERLEKQRSLDITQIEGIRVGGRISVTPKNAKRITRDRRREALLRRRSMTVTVGGEEKDVSETGKYMLDMLIKEEPSKKK